MEIRETFAMKVTHVEGDQIPVWYRGQKVGFVTNVRATYIIDDIEHSEITVSIDDDALKAALSEHIETQQPVLQIYFPRTPIDNIYMTFKVG